MTHTTIDITDGLPIDCSLTGADYRERVAHIRQLARDALVARCPIDGGARLTFEGTADVRQRLEAIVAAESICCPFLTMNLSSHQGQLVLEVTGPELAAPIIEELIA
jgi:hypothetical protein